MKPELYLSDALGAVGKPMFRVHTAGSVGGTTGIVAASHVQAGKHRPCARRRVREAVRGQRPVRARQRQGASLGAGGAFAPFIRGLHPPQRRARAHRVEGRGQGPAERAEEPVRPPEDRGHLDREGEGVPDDVGARSATSSRARRPTARARSCSPTRQAARPPPPTAGRRRGSSARRRGASRRASRAATRCARRRAVALRGRRLRPGRASPTRATQIDMAELYVPFSWHEAIWLEGHDIAEPGEGWRMIDDGETALDGSFPVNRVAVACCRATRSARPGLLRFAEAANQVRGAAGEHQVDGARGRAGAWPTAPTASTSACGSSPPASSPFG